MSDNEPGTGPPKRRTISERALDLITRTDPAIPPLTPADIRDLEGKDRQLILATVVSAARDAAPVLQCLAVHEKFLAAYRLESLTQADPAQFLDFVTAAEDPACQHLRRNTLLTAQRCLASAGRMDAAHPLADIQLPRLFLPARSHPRSGSDPDRPRAAQVVTSTSDEILLMRCSTDFTRGRDRYRAGAALALNTAGAGPREGAAARWLHLGWGADGMPIAVDLSGTHLTDPGNERYQAPRTAQLDAWEQHAMTDWFEEAAPEVQSRRSVIYTANGKLNSDSAAMSYTKALNLVREAAALPHAPGATPGGIAYWSAAWTIAFRGLDAAVAAHGAAPATIISKLGL